MCLQILKEALEEMDVDKADELSAYLSRFEYNDEISKMISELSNMVLNLESDAGVQLIEEITKKLQVFFEP
jgi:hypothetical protein